MQLVTALQRYLAMRRDMRRTAPDFGRVDHQVAARGQPTPRASICAWANGTRTEKRQDGAKTNETA
jgi:hypothetical protein